MTLFFYLTDLILTILIMSLTCHGIALLFWDEMIFESVGKWYQRKIDKIDQYKNNMLNYQQNSTAGFIQGVIEQPIKPCITDYIIKSVFKPIVGCVVCYASFWGTVIYFSIKFASNQQITVNIIPEWIICCLATVFINYKLNK